ncbi:energy transducer TonB [Lewinella sp. IMCC34191]|uniref:energy transducer TonB n=1 Tax=Lewinella sp. IMCC34191 TaxID=2259172 RepID=UPI000E21F798|nr:energy transducer TonB [Lewinella sp. IMCC34191]
MRHFIYLFLLSLPIAVHAQSEGESPQPNEQGVYEEVEQMPTFKADCPEGDDYKACADNAMLTYVYHNVKYPAEAREAEAEGMAVVSFVVEKDGTISQASIYRDPGYGMGAEVLRIVKGMNASGARWNPGMQEGEAVRTEFKLPVKFSLGK